MAAKRDNTKEGWEVSDFPIVCETCLGENPYVRMTRLVHGDECKVCSRPFTVFRWNPGAKMRFKKTEICQMCAKVKNICQTCLLDLHYGLPVQVRDTLLKIKDEFPKADINRAFMYENLDKTLAKGDSLVDYGKADPVGKEILKKLARTEPYYQRNLPHACSFYAKGTCKRGDECPYRHELIAVNEQLSNQKIKDRYFGSNDPVAAKILDKVPKMLDITPPEDATITTIVLFDLPAEVDEKKLRDLLYIYGDITSVHRAKESNTTFVQFLSRQSAELAMERCLSGLVIDGTRYKLAWARPRHHAKDGRPAKKMYDSQSFTSYDTSSSASSVPLPGESPVTYPSQDPGQVGSQIRIKSLNPVD